MINPGLIIAAVNLTGTISFTIPSGPANLIDNGTFDSDAGWTLGGAAAVADGKLSSVGAGTASRATNTSIAEGSYYRITYTTADTGAGVSLSLGGGDATPVRNGNGTFTEYVIAGPTQTFLASITGGSIDDVVIEGPLTPTVGAELVENGGFDDGTGWTLLGSGTSAMAISGGTLNYTGGSGSRRAVQAEATLTAETAYLVSFTISNATDTTAIRALLGNTTVGGVLRTGNGTFTQIIRGGTDSTDMTVFANGSFYDASIDDFSVKELTFS